MKYDCCIDWGFGYLIFYCCFYLCDIENFFMVGCCISVIYEVFGMICVMKMCGMMGEVVGWVVSICVKNDCLLRDVYECYYDELDEFMYFFGKVWCLMVIFEIVILDDVLELVGLFGVVLGFNLVLLLGLVVDDCIVKWDGEWIFGIGF